MDSTDQVSQAPRTIGRRERQKALKRQRLLAAAEQLFQEQGYDGTTTREIAKVADVAVGTLFAYACDKRDLLLMLLNDRLETLFSNATATRPNEQPLLDQLTQLFQPIYEFFAAERNVALGGMREIAAIGEPSPSDTPEVRRLHERRRRTNQMLSAIIEDARRSGQISSSGPSASMIADLILAIQSVYVRRWLSHPSSSVEDGLQQLRDHLRILVNGLVGHPSV